MQLVPVLEIRRGKGVHTEPKNAFVDAVVKQDVQEIVASWVEKGIDRLHLVDVDAIESGEPENVDLISKVKQAFPHIKFQVLGGIKSVEDGYVWLDAGADFLVLSSKVLRQRNLLDDMCVEFPNRILVEVDCIDGKVGLGAGQPMQQIDQLARQFEEDGVVGLVVTEVGVNGSGYAHLSNLTESLRIPVYANGMIDKFSDLKHLLESHNNRPSGLLIGKAMYSEEFSLSEAASLLSQYQGEA